MRLSNIVSPRNEKVQPADFPELPFIGLDNIEAHTMRLLGTKKSINLKSSAKRFYCGDVLYSRLRPYLNKVFCANFDGICSSEFIVFPENNYIDAQFLALRLNAIDFVTFANSLNAGDRPRVDFKQISSFFLPPFSLTHQRCIVAKIEELFSELDKGIESLKTAQEQLKVYRQALLKQAFEGKLTEQWRKDNADKLETSEQLLERIKQEREARYQQQLEDWKDAVKRWKTDGKEGKKPIKPAKFIPFHSLSKVERRELPLLPDGWQWVHLSDVVEKIQIGPFGSLLHKKNYIKNGTPLVNPSHIKNMTIIPNQDLTVSDEKLVSLEKYIMSKSDIVIGRRGEMGRCAVVGETEDGWLCGTGSLFISLLQSLNSEFYCHILSSRRTREYLSDSSIGTTMKNLNQKILQNVPVPICNQFEQIEIISELNRQFSILDKVLADIEENLEKSKILRQSILKKAFSGQLVPQNPNDEPASELLKRIAAEKEKTQKAAKAKKAKQKKAKPRKRKTP